MGKFALKFGREDLLLSISHSLETQSTPKQYNTDNILTPTGSTIIDEGGKPTSSRRDFDINYSTLNSKHYILIPVTTSVRGAYTDYTISISTENQSEQDTRMVKTTLDSSFTSMYINVNYNKGKPSITIMDGINENYKVVFDASLYFMPQTLIDLVITYLKLPFELIDTSAPLVKPISTQKPSSPLPTPTSKKELTFQPSEEEDDMPELEDFVAPSTPKTPYIPETPIPYIFRDKVFGSNYMQVGSYTTSESEEDLLGVTHPMLREKTYSSLYTSTASSYYDTTDSETQGVYETWSVTGIGRSSEDHHEGAA